MNDLGQNANMGLWRQRSGLAHPPQL